MITEDNVQPVVTISEAGECTVSAEAVSAKFGWTSDTFRRLMRRGLVHAVLERGIGNDDGKWRVAVRCGNRRWTASVAADGTILEERFETVKVRSS